MTNVLQYFIGDPIRFRNSSLAWFRMSQMLHERTNGSFDAAFMAVARLLRPKLALPVSKSMSDGDVGATVDSLRGDGYAALPLQLTEHEIRAINQFAFSTPAHGCDINKSLAITATSIPRSEGRYYWRPGDLIELPEIQNLICNGPFCKIAQDYLGCRPMLAGITLFLDPPYQGNYSPHNYHYDNDGPGFLKFFIYLTDAGLGTGAHYYIKGTQPHTKPQQLRRAKIYSEEDLFAHFNREREVVATAKAGTIIAEDTAGFHRGSTITQDYRLLMQLMFSVVDIPDESDLTRKIAPAVVPGLHAGIGKIVHKFFTAGH
jgi:hypothetical protein